MNSRYEQQALADVQAHPFDPYHLRPLASLDRRRLIPCRRAVDQPGPTILCSVAAYVEDGEPVRMEHGAYTSLHRLSPDIRAWFCAQIGETVGTPRGVVQIEFVHDCDVAACALAGRPNAVVLMLGSGLGVGFVPPAEGHRPLAERFALEQSQDISIDQPGGGR